VKVVSAGDAFEHYIFKELIAYSELNEKHYEINYWRTKTGLEVDFVLDKGRISIEVKISDNVVKQNIKGLVEFSKDYQPEKAIVVSLDPRRRKLIQENGTDILIMPWQEFLEKLWAHEIL